MKNVSTNNAGVGKEVKKDTPEQTKKLRIEFSKKKVSGKEDMELRRGAAAIASKLCDDSNKANEVTLHKDIKAFFSEKKRPGCWHCLSANCFIKQKICRDNNMEARFI